ncbi:amino acid adenylation domain-containing protein [Streptomyces sp. NPDC002908]|uniref:non-ribosomal peptide synthetase n=1 Tax=Streptomyces sp. NPDC002908 TaxID=3364670 RepID=UPI00369CB8F0
MSDTATLPRTAPTALPALGPIQRAYLVGTQDGLELSGPARYYLSCDLDPDRAAGIGARLRELVRSNDILRVRADAGLALTVLPPDVADAVDADVRQVEDDAFDAADTEVRRLCTDDRFAFGDWPQLEVTVVRSAHRARLHLVYSLWLMDAASLAAFLTGLVTDGGAPDTESCAVPPAPDAAASSAAPPAPRRSRTARDERFWRERAASLAGPAELPLRPGWRHTGPRVSHRMVTLDPATAQRIEERAAARGLTPAMVHLAVYGTVLGRLGGGAAHTVTVLHSRRSGPAGPGGLGNHGSSMPLEIPAAAGFADTAREVQRRYLTQAVHGSLGGAEIMRLADPSADLSRLAHPYAFTALDADTRGESAAGLRRRWDDVQLRVPQVLIDHQAVRESDGSVRLGFDWRTDAFDPGFADHLVECCVRLSRDLAADDAPWDAPPARRPAPARRRPAGPARSETLHGRVLATAARTPDAPAVHDEGGTLSYAGLVALARAAADTLRGAGARPGDRVAVHLPRGRGQVVAVLGALLAGCVYVPLDDATPDGRLDGIARRGGVRFALTEPGDGARWTERGAVPLPLPGKPSPTAPSPTAPFPDGAPGHPTAYVIFTSGSTGEPKGVVVSHTAVLGTVDAVNDMIGLSEADRVLSVSSIGFDLSVYDLFGPLLRGGSVVMLSPDSARSPARWVELVHRHGVTVWNSAPALASLLAEERSALPSLRSVLLSGDWIPLSLPGALCRLAPRARITSLGGATEGAIWSIAHPVGEEDCAGRSIPYGRALPGQEILVLDPLREVCPDWQVGEIHIAGAGVADGYADDPERTAAAFFDDPVYGWTYRTGDRGRRHPCGTIEFLGRTDNQVKLNGHRVELGEIEHRLEQAPAVRSAAVCVRGDGRRRRLAGFVTLAPGAPADWRSGVTAGLRDTLPAYMLPDVLVALDELPLNGNGKIDRRRLAALPITPEPGSTAPGPADPATAPGSGDGAGAPLSGLHGHEVAACWREVLGRPPGTGSFFDAGGTSYDAIRLLSLLRSGYGHEVSFGDFMGDPTARGLAALCLRSRPADPTGVWTHRPRTCTAPRLRLVLFAPVGGGVSCYTGLVRGLGDDVDVHVVGLDAPADAAGATTLPELARQCLRRLPAVTRGDGVPTVFAGWSFGGALAYEAACSGEARTARVVVVDTPVATAARASGEATWEDFLHDVRQTAGATAVAGDATADPALADRFAVHRRNTALLRTWAPRPSERLPLVELRAVDAPAEPDGTAWARLAHREECVSLAGGHFQVFDGDNLRLVRNAIEGAACGDAIEGVACGDAIEHVTCGNATEGEKCDDRL